MVKKVKVKASTAPDKNALAAALEAGKPVAGISGYVSAQYDEAPIFVKVTCLGLVTDEDVCGIKVLAEVASSKSQIQITPCKFFDSLERVKGYQETLARFQKACADFEQISESRYLANRREATEIYVSKLSEEQQKAFWAEVEQRHGTGKPLSGKLPQICSRELCDLVTTLVLEANHISPAVAQEYGFNDRSSYWRW